MNNEVETLVETLNSIQREILKVLPFETGKKRILKERFSTCIGRLRDLGYGVKFRKTRGKAEWIWFAVPLDDLHAGNFSKNTECGYEYTNVRPDRKTLKGD